MRTLRKLYNRWFGIRGAALACSKPSFLWSVYKESMDGLWYFSFFNEDHTRGEIRGGFDTKGEAYASRDRWASANTDAVITEA